MRFHLFFKREANKGGMLIPFQVRLLEKLTHNVNKRENLNLFSCMKGFREILRFSRTEIKQSRVTFTIGDKSHLTLVHRWTNQARVSVKSPCHILILALLTCPFATLSRGCLKIKQKQQELILINHTILPINVSPPIRLSRI